MVTHSSNLAWKIHWAGEPGRLALEVARVGLDLVTKQQHFVLYDYYYSSFLLISICMEYLFPSPSVLLF